MARTIMTDNIPPEELHIGERVEDLFPGTYVIPGNIVAQYHLPKLKVYVADSAYINNTPEEMQRARQAVQDAATYFYYHALTQEQRDLDRPNLERPENHVGTMRRYE